MDELGFFMDQNGNTIYYGRWVQEIDYNDPEQLHESSFKMDVESKELFQSLHLEYDSTMSVHGKVKVFAVQGIVSMLNVSVGHNKDCMHLHVPIDITEPQKDKLSELYNLLSSFDNQIIYIYPSKIVEDRKKFEDINEFYDMFSINKGKDNIKKM